MSTGPSAEQLAVIERNRQRALLKQQKSQRNLTTDEVYQLEKYNELKVATSQDSGGGYFIESDSVDKSFGPGGILAGRASTSRQESLPVLADTRENVCDECEDRFSNSFLLSNFGEKICDQCKELRGRHSLITRTEAKSEYLLTDVDLDKREPPLRCMLKKNPHEFARGFMKLYLRLQVEERALEVWGSEQKLEEERDRRKDKRESRKRKQFDSQMKELRMSTRSSCYQKRLHSSGHEHEFGEETPIEKDDDPDGEYYQQVCATCGFEKVFEKL